MWPYGRIAAVQSIMWKPSIPAQRRAPLLSRLGVVLVFLVAGAPTSTAAESDDARRTAFLWSQTGKNAITNRLSANIDSRVGSSKTAFLSKRQEKRRNTSSKLNLEECPPPAPCNCHCECPEPELQAMPIPPEPCPPLPTVMPTPEPKAEPPRCAVGEVKKSDGSCMEITVEVIKALQLDVFKKEKDLHKAQAEFKAISRAQAALREKKRRNLLKAHEIYAESLDLLVGAWDMAPFRVVKEEKVEAEKEEPTGDFVEVEKVERGVPHCETWMRRNDTYVATKEECAVLCRHEPMCVGFAQSVAGKYCVWFDENAPDEAPKDDSEDEEEDLETCASSLEAPEYKKLHQIPSKTRDIFNNVAMVHRLHEIYTMQMLDTDVKSGEAGTNFKDWMHTGVTEATDDQLEQFIVSKKSYAAQVAQTKMIYFNLTDTADKVKLQLREEAVAEPPFYVAPPPPPVPTPKPWSWAEDDPNAQDTKWSKAHPDCPQGPPCFCDCKCRGAPPQNFVEPPAPPPEPCPPPPDPPSPTELTPIN